MALVHRTIVKDGHKITLEWDTAYNTMHIVSLECPYLEKANKMLKKQGIKTSKKKLENNVEDVLRKVK